jgi:predicted protein tyrosine phosphatase
VLRLDDEVLGAEAHEAQPMTTPSKRIAAVLGAAAVRRKQLVGRAMRRTRR